VNAVEERESHEGASSDLCMCPIDFYSSYFLLAFNGFVVSSVLIPLDYSYLFCCLQMAAVSISFFLHSAYFSFPTLTA